MQSEERKVREAPPGDIFLPKILLTSVGHFWGILDTRGYTRARYDVVESTVDSIIIAPRYVYVFKSAATD